MKVISPYIMMVKKNHPTAESISWRKTVWDEFVIIIEVAITNPLLDTDIKLESRQTNEYSVWKGPNGYRYYLFLKRL